MMHGSFTAGGMFSGGTSLNLNLLDHHSAFVYLAEHDGQAGFI